MTDVRVEAEQIIDEVVGAEQDAEDRVDEAGSASVEEATQEVDEMQACGTLDSLSGELLVPPADEETEGDLASEDHDVASARAVDDQAQRASLGDLAPISRLDGVPLWYGRASTPRPQTFFVDPPFRDLLVRTTKTVRARAPESFGKLIRITSAGAYVSKPGMHGLGRAFDHDAWMFEEVDISPIRHDHSAPSLNRRMRYWPLAALMRSHSAHLLHGEYDAAHRDHLHFDNGGSLPFRTTSPATVKLVQAVSNEIFGESPRLTVDGELGPKTTDAVREALRRLRLDGDLSSSLTWTRFLRRSGRLGFELSMR